MPFTPKDWRDSPETSTPLSAAALEDLETRLAAYTDEVRAAITAAAIGAATPADLATHEADTTNVHGIANTADLLTAATADALFLTQAEGDARYALAGAGGDTLPATGWTSDPRSGAAAVVTSASGAYLQRVVWPKTGTLSGLYAYCGAAAGNYDIGVYSAASPRARLSSKGSTAVATGWIGYNPALAVTKGVAADLAFTCDTTTTATFLRLNAVTAAFQLPAGSMPEGAGTPYLWGLKSASFPLPASIAEPLGSTSYAPILIFTIT